MRRLLKICLALVALVGILTAVWYYFNPTPNYIEIYNDDEDNF